MSEVRDMEQANLSLLLSQKGFTLIEVMVAIGIIGIVIITFVRGSWFATKQMTANRDYTLADNLAIEKLEEIRANYGRFIPYQWESNFSANPENVYYPQYNGGYKYIGAGKDIMPIDSGSIGVLKQNFHGREFRRYWITYSSYQDGIPGDGENVPIYSATNPKEYLIARVRVEWKDDNLAKPNKWIERVMVLR